MSPESARALVWVSLFLVSTGALATSHAANFILPLLALVVALLPASFGSGRTRLLASIVLTISLLAAMVEYPGYRAHMERWMTRAEAAGRSSEHPGQP